MIDQATKLREMMKTSNQESNDKENKQMAKVISISSGKGGVGKTNFALNFSISLKRLGYEVVVIDADIGLSNIEILSGTNLPFSMSDIVFTEKKINDIIGIGPEGIKIISGGSGLNELKLLDSENFPKLLADIETLQYEVDYIIIDTGAGISNAVTNFIMASDEVIIVSTPDPTSLMDSYTLIKSIVSNGFKGKINIVSNMVSKRKEGREIFNKLSNATSNFLRVQINFFGYIERDKIITNAIRNQIPFIISHPDNQNSKMINAMAMNFINNSNIELEDNSGFAKKILSIFYKKRWIDGW